MCGIVAAIAHPIAHRNIVPVLIEGLNKLEYRGYDSAGLAKGTDVDKPPNLATWVTVE